MDEGFGGRVTHLVWKFCWPIFAVIMALVCGGGAAHAEPAGNVFHYACKSYDAHYALTVNTNRGIVKMLAHRVPYTLTTFRILKAIPPCGKGGWTLSDGAIFCYYTQGGASLDWHGHEFECDQADTE
jgi:hypothetical protein